MEFGIALHLSPKFLTMYTHLRTGLRAALQSFPKDARHYQISFLLLFLFTGIFSLKWPIDPNQIFITFFIALIVQTFGIIFLKLPITSLKSAFISSLSLCLLFRCDQYIIIALAALITIASKFVFRAQGKHFFNPANIGICATILLTGQGWISPGQWGSDGLWLFVVGILGFLVVTKANRMELAISFLVGYGGAQIIRMYFYQGWPADALTHLFTNGALLLFTFFVVTDPASTPTHKTVRIIWALAVGLLAFYLQAYKWVNGSPIWALFILSPLTPLLDYLFKGEKFQWTKSDQSSTQLAPIIHQ
jgi:Na+-transporting NADH:ubiquinone oxidoreductase subunit NqrB